MVLFVFDRFDVVAGLLPKYIVPPGGTKPKLIACIGDEELMDNKSGVYCIPTFPTLMQMMSLRIANCQLFIPNRTNLELMLSEYINKVTYEGKEENRAQILNRTLSFGEFLTLVLVTITFCLSLYK